MAKSKQKIKALRLREEKGESIKQIAKEVGVSKSTVSLWCRDIELSEQQIKKLHERMVKMSYIGRMKGARSQYDARIKRIEDAKIKGKEVIGKLSDRELLIAITALYWGEGCKKSRQFAINNSDPEMIKFIVNTFRKVWKIEDNRFAPYVGINIIHKKRDEEIKDYWSKIIKIPKEQFRKTIFIKAKNKKVYKNFLSYYGTLTVRVLRPMEFYNQIMGLIKGIADGAN